MAVRRRDSGRNNKTNEEGEWRSRLFAGSLIHGQGLSQWWLAHRHTALEWPNQHYSLDGHSTPQSKQCFIEVVGLSVLSLLSEIFFLCCLLKAL